MITYAKAGVNVTAGNNLVERIKKFAPLIGGFSDGIPLPKGYKEPILIGCADGVGTKLAIAQALNKHDTIGYDLVGMNLNDLICSGAKPLFFLDYFACGKLNVKQAETVVKSIAQACEEGQCVLLGGETAEMPGFYKPGEYDLAGFATGVVDREKKLQPKQWIKEGDILMGLPSSGLHSNGYSLVRKVIPRREWKKFSKELLAPTKLYVKDVLPVIEKLNANGEHSIKGLVHVTGGGFIENIPRILPTGVSARIFKNSWSVPPIFKEIQKRAKASEQEMFRTYNMGIGLIMVIDLKAKDEVRQRLPHAMKIGDIVRGNRDVRFV